MNASDRKCGVHEPDFYKSYALVVLGMRGGSCRSILVQRYASVLLEDKLTEADRQYMRRKRSYEVVPTTANYPGISWQCWRRNFTIALSSLVDDGLIKREDGVYVLTDQGIKQLAVLAESGISASEFLKANDVKLRLMT